MPKPTSGTENRRRMIEAAESCIRRVRISGPKRGRVEVNNDADQNAESPHYGTLAHDLYLTATMTDLSTCLNGHDPEFTFIRPNGARVCTKCRDTYHAMSRIHTPEKANNDQHDPR